MIHSPLYDRWMMILTSRPGCSHRPTNQTQLLQDRDALSAKPPVVWFALPLITALLLSLGLCFSSQALAQGGGFIRDAETEDLMRDYARPIFRVAGLARQNIRIHLINNMSFNAFVVDGQNMFFNVGALTRSKTPNQLIGVIAHETGHIAGGHLARMRERLKRPQNIALILLGQAFQRTMLKYQRTEESSADQAALSYLNATRQSAKGMLETFERFADEGLASLRHVDPYLQSHPMPRERIAQLRYLARQSPYFHKKDPPALQRRHDLMRAKLIGFLERPQSVYRLYPKSDRSLPARYARAIATYRSEGLLRFLPLVNDLLSSDPKNPYFWELKGQFLLESGRPAEAVAPLTKAVRLAPKSGLIRLMLAQAQLRSENPRLLDRAIKNLRIALVQERQSAQGYRLLAQAYGKKRMVGHAELASAHAYLFEHNLAQARRQAMRAKKRFKRGSPEWVQADDILNHQPPTR